MSRSAAHSSTIRSVIAGTAGTVLVGAGANVDAIGTIIGHIQLGGELRAAGPGPGVLKISGDITGGGTLAPLTTLEVHGVLGANASTVFGTSTPLQPGVLILDDARDEFGTISSFDQGNTISIPSGHFTDALFTPGGSISTGTLTLSGGGEIPLTLVVAGNYGASDFIASSDTIGTTVTLVPCFTAGTSIATERGPVAVEALREGDRLLTFSGGMRPVRWIGHRVIDLTRHSARWLIEPIRIRKDALTDGQPYRDVLVSPDHALFMKGVLVPARLLVNGASIVRETAEQRVMYYHVELDAHDIIFADGMPTEKLPGHRQPGDVQGMASACRTCTRISARKASTIGSNRHISGRRGTNSGPRRVDHAGIRPPSDTPDR